MDKLAAWSKLSYTDLAFEVMSLFATDIPAADLRQLVADAYSTFDHPEVAPSIEVGEFQILELFHGPTLAFKDVALQLLGQLFGLANRLGQGVPVGNVVGDRMDSGRVLVGDHEPGGDGPVMLENLAESAAVQ